MVGRAEFAQPESTIYSGDELAGLKSKVLTVQIQMDTPQWQVIDVASILTSWSNHSSQSKIDAPSIVDIKYDEKHFLSKKFA